ncbi:asparagine--tRNA ligase [Candidatus Uhrbacteria bacterium CG22_combo_CG10-13_8_21_14_all_47_17]|uniref:Asparagine--tRNA ligase n=1 Tax=Candidatus Uhrbacteria bacterium CG22_combo_CG10-13_8_21_14_all_47_17 TaxID=1975041 RepID=A0A2H0BRB6_9BACT|nr:MAG: asparagine--tRNA ligase [Candidatus Uhrbacteria bacterium CG22_combo_CG10-13_8_21_14_all_47_17]
MDVQISQFSKHVGEKVTVKGWVYNVRSSGSIAFLQIRDGSSFTQAVVVKDQVSEKAWEQTTQITIESSLIIMGEVSRHPKKEGVFELQATELSIVQRAEEFPIGKKEHGPDFLLDQRHLWLRVPAQWAIQRIRNEIIYATYDWMRENGYLKIDSPIFTPNACEGTTELFEIDYFGERTAYLSQSGQLYLEAAISSVGRCFDFGPVFRAEKSKTRRHLTEFWMMDAEAAFVEHEENMQIQEALIIFIVGRVLKNCHKELEILERDVEALEKVQAPFIRMTHAEAIAKLRTLGSDIGDMDDLGADDETILTKEFDKPIFIEKYPAAVKAFYMKPDAEDSTRVLNSDLLAPEGYGEIIGGSQREDDHDALLERIRKHGLSEKDFGWYLDLRKYGSVPHSGFGFGLERITAWICGIHHVRETIPFPRLINRLEP